MYKEIISYRHSTRFRYYLLSFGINNHSRYKSYIEYMLKSILKAQQRRNYKEMWCKIFQLLYRSKTYEHFIVCINSNKGTRFTDCKAFSLKTSVYRFMIKKSDGTGREITAYKSRAKLFSLKLLYILERLLPKEPDFMMGSIRGRTVGQCLEFFSSSIGKGRWLIEKADIKSYYSSVDRGKLACLLQQHIPNNLIGIMNRLMEVGIRSGLATGSNISPKLANFYLSSIMGPQQRLLVYLDDIILWRSLDEMNGGSQLELLEDSLKRFGLSFNKDKTSYHLAVDGMVHTPVDYLGFTFKGSKCYRKGFCVKESDIFLEEHRANFYLSNIHRNTGDTCRRFMP